MNDRIRRPAFSFWVSRLSAVIVATLTLYLNPVAHAADPIKIGFSTSLTGGLASSGKA